MQAIDIRFHAALVKAVQDERNKVASALAKGMASDFAEYKYSCGVLEGLRRVQDLADALVKEADASSKDVFQST